MLVELDPVLVVIGWKHCGVIGHLEELARHYLVLRQATFEHLQGSLGLKAKVKRCIKNISWC
jgi:hypothetical protein